MSQELASEAEDKKMYINSRLDGPRLGGEAKPEAAEIMTNGQNGPSAAAAATPKWTY